MPTVPKTLDGIRPSSQSVRGETAIDYLFEIGVPAVVQERTPFLAGGPRGSPRGPPPGRGQPPSGPRPLAQGGSPREHGHPSAARAPPVRPQPLPPLCVLRGSRKLEIAAQGGGRRAL